MRRGTTLRRDARWLPVLGAAALLWLCFRESLATYLSDHFYQSHFLFLWLLFAAAVHRAGRGAAVAAPALRGTRSAAGLGVLALAVAVYASAVVSGSSTVERLALVLLFTAWLLLAVRGFGSGRCLAFGAFALLCFGVPYAAYTGLTQVFRASFMALVQSLPQWTPLSFAVRGSALEFAHYRLEITADCSGFNQLVTFCGIAFLGSLTGRLSVRRVGMLFAAAVGLAYAANLARVVSFVGLVAIGQQRFVDDPVLHAGVGLAIYAPFVVGLVWLILRSHRPRPVGSAPAVDGGRRLPAMALLLPFVGVRLALGGGPAAGEPGIPAYMAGTASPPGYRLVLRSPREAGERAAYATPHLINACFAATSAPAHEFELLAYWTTTRRQLAVHQLGACLGIPGQRLRYGPPVDVGGRRFWTVELRAADRVQHGYFSFWVEGEDHDDSLATMLAVFSRRLIGGAAAVGLTRILMPGPLRVPIPAADRRVLEWRARGIAAAAAPPAGSPK